MREFVKESMESIKSWGLNDLKAFGALCVGMAISIAIFGVGKSILAAGIMFFAHYTLGSIGIPIGVTTITAFVARPYCCMFSEQEFDSESESEWETESETESETEFESEKTKESEN